MDNKEMHPNDTLTMETTLPPTEESRSPFVSKDSVMPPKKGKRRCENRLSTALRDNLKKRKVQQKERIAND